MGEQAIGVVPNREGDAVYAQTITGRYPDVWRYYPRGIPVCGQDPLELRTGALSQGVVKADVGGWLATVIADADRIARAPRMAVPTLIKIRTTTAVIVGLQEKIRGAEKWLHLF